MVHIFTTYISKIHFNIILRTSVDRLSYLLASRFPTKSFYAFVVGATLRLISSSNAEAHNAWTFTFKPIPPNTTTMYAAVTPYFIFTFSIEAVTVHFVQPFYCFVSICFCTCSKPIMSCVIIQVVHSDSETRNNRGFWCDQ